MSQQMLADATGLAKGTITRAESGDENVSFANIARLAEALHVSPDELIFTDPDAKA
jgi:transcriptional regulator with XRE-family HTH domain